MDSQTSFLDLSREIRNMVYDYALEDVKFSNAFTTQTAYSPDVLPLLYVHKIISDDLEPRLYQKHAIVIPLQEPSTYAAGDWSIVPKITCSKMMQQRSDTLIIEMSQTIVSYYQDSDLEEDEDEDPAEDEPFWDSDSRAVNAFPEKLVNDILALKSSLLALKTIKLVFWFGNWTVYRNSWSKHLEKLKATWPEPLLKIELNMFDYVDRDAGDSGQNWIEGWYYWAIGRKRVCFQANNFKWKDHAKGDFRGREIDVRVWQDREFTYWDDEKRDRALHTRRCEVKPLFVRTCDMED